MRFVVHCRLCAAVVVETGDWFETTGPIDAHLTEQHPDLPRPDTDAMLFALVAVSWQRDAAAVAPAPAQLHPPRDGDD